MIKAIVWDIGGVILTDPLLGNLWQNADNSKNLRTAFGEGKISTKDFLQKGAKLLNMSEDKFKEEYTKIYCSIYEMDGIFELLQNVKVPQYILSDTNPIHGNYIKSNFSNILQMFNKVFLSHEIGMRKNSEQVFHYVAKEIKCNPEEILFIDNRERKLNYAKNSGYQTCLFNNSVELKNYLTTNNLI